jgi:hypothetical protein
MPPKNARATMTNVRRFGLIEGRREYRPPCIEP